ncbi:hypothetical protein AVEN_117762-1 [Araneus ventricosus]|uniref:F-box domain-containing protein n=1 Tax=Araneus ventricosus TaxID=182803 RepID=A0A4Y2B751_ARAVE|nr:hypothetical protein AVEN_117762-1 [Araneus ventricosus]
MHLDIYPGFDVIRKCQNLRILRLYFLSKIDLSVLAYLRNLEVLHVPYMDTDVIADVLDICPNLISIGLNDSLDSMEEIVQRRLENSFFDIDDDSQLKLRRCVWGKRFMIKDTHGNPVYKSSFCDRLTFPVNLCPLVQELIIQVHQKDGYKALRFLKQLTLQRINFWSLKDDFVSDFVALLQEIGPQLKHLFIKFRLISYVTVAFICRASNQIDGFTFVENSSESSGNLSLKRLRLSSDGDIKEGLLFLVSNCKHLEELFLYGFESFDDTLFNQIFERNPFPALKVICIEDCCGAREGY